MVFVLDDSDLVGDDDSGGLSSSVIIIISAVCGVVALVIAIVVVSVYFKMKKERENCSSSSTDEILNFNVNGNPTIIYDVKEDLESPINAFVNNHKDSDIITEDEDEDDPIQFQEDSEFIKKIVF